jgi:hypothetical protein
MLFRDDSGAQWNAGEILKVSPSWTVSGDDGERHVRTLVFKNGGELIVGEAAAHSLFRVALHTFPAEPGYNVVTFDEEKEEARLQPVLGWAVTMGLGVRPITMHGVNAGLDTKPPILLPDGQVEASNGLTYKSVDAYVAYMAAFLNDSAD